MQRLMQVREVRAAPGVVCPDCPALHDGTVFGALLPTRPGTCAFRCASLAAREAIPQRWLEYGFGLVRRGVLIRQRVDGSGRATAIDAAGPGCLFPLAPWGGPSAVAAAAVFGYAAIDSLVCLCPSETLRAAAGGDATLAMDLARLQRLALERVERIAEARGRSKAAARIASTLGALADTLSPGRTCEQLPADLQQKDIAALSAVRHEAVCRVLGGLVKRGVVARSRDGLRILDRAQLDAM